MIVIFSQAARHLQAVIWVCNLWSPIVQRLKTSYINSCEQYHLQEQKQRNGPHFSGPHLISFFMIGLDGFEAELAREELEKAEIYLLG